ncbi:glycosyltransferase family A protein [Microvirga sp. BSC39]|uniref:glycosyltransferase family 2 protein n=1 Tax=Microvirga sp. BSC39 TaxID=1549810 RepID=UPI0004E9211E|nr:glycosyltransferase family A protein [Microvirga sp. BSC39]KFG70318.1 hypothetical protein JH26_05345 [Microvirga sp. BSC39]
MKTTMLKPPTIDVLLPAFNAESTLRESLQSLLDQTFEDFRILVIDDGSTDGTAALVSTMAAADARIILFSKPNSGIVDTLNMGLEKATAEFIARLDADDISFPERFEAQLAYLRGHPNCVAVSSNAYHIDSVGQRTGTSTTFGVPTGNPTWAPSREPYLMHPFLMARRAALVTVGGYRHVNHAEDVDLYWRLRKLGELHNLPDIHGEYRVHPGSISSKSIVNGRVLALSGQLAALSERRRREGRSDLPFERNQLDAFHAAGSLQGMIYVAASMLSDEEQNYLEIATAAKLLETSVYRPFEPTVEDCAFIAKAIRNHAGGLCDENRKELIFMQARTSRRLLASGYIREAMALTPVHLYPKVAAYHIRLKTGRAWGNVN